MKESDNKLKFPRLQRAVLRSFSLFSSLPEIEVKFNDGVFCLVGANGLGKSSFLAAISYGLTGVVPNFNKKFESVEEYYQESMGFCREYFTGRIEESDREAAEIEIDFSVEEISYTLVRGMFEPHELRNLKIYDSKTEKDIFLSEDSKKDNKELNDEYIKHILGVTKLESFAQLVFLQHFIFTFDERRHLLFWDQKVLEQALHFAFGVDSTKAKEANLLRREMERADSLARNAQWQASQIRKKISELRKKVGDISIESEESKEEIFDKYMKLVERNASEVEKVELLEAQIKDENLKLIELNSRLSNYRLGYDEEFNKRLKEQFHVKHHPLVVSSIAEIKCGLCGATGKTVVKQITERTGMNKCPLCDSGIDQGKVSVKVVQKLQQIDEDLIKTRTELDNIMKSVSRMNSELEVAKKKQKISDDELEEFESQNKILLSELKKASGTPDSLDKVLESYRLQMEEFTKRKQFQYEKRDQKREQLNSIQKEIQDRYYSAELEFVPLFKELAFMFLGIDLNIQLQANRGTLNLILEVRNTARRQNHQLSESQRFFVDIALRMALARYISDPNSKASLFIDTPEGSLDVAYESRAGSMFAQFVNAGFDIIMTVNINSSRMIRSLAEKCGKKKMVICRMTNWTELSEVQSAEEALFEQVYKEMEQSLNAKKS